MTSILFAYFGPETMMPLTSIVAGAIGLFLMFGQTVIRYARQLLQGRLFSAKRSPAFPKPHFRVEPASQAVEQGYAEARGVQGGGGGSVGREER